MSKTNPTGDQPLRETEAAAYQAYREWPVFLVLRQKELQALQTGAEAAPSTATARTPPTESKTNETADQGA